MIVKHNKLCKNKKGTSGAGKFANFASWFRRKAKLQDRIWQVLLERETNCFPLDHLTTDFCHRSLKLLQGHDFQF